MSGDYEILCSLLRALGRSEAGPIDVSNCCRDLERCRPVPSYRLGVIVEDCSRGYAPMGSRWFGGHGIPAAVLSREYDFSRATIYNTNQWTKEHVIAVDDLYRQHDTLLGPTHPDLIALAERLQRVSTSVYLRMRDLQETHSEPGRYPGSRGSVAFTKLDRKVADR